MKTKLLISLLCFYAITISAQVTQKVNDKETLAGGKYLITETKTFTVAEYKIASDVSIEKDDYVKIITDDGDYVTFKNVTPEDETLVTESTYESKKLPKYLFFYYAKQQFNRYKGAGWGIYTVPFKVRAGKNFDFEAALSLAANVVFGFGNKSSTTSWIDGSFGIGFTSIPLTTDNSKVTQNRSATALTLSTGAVIKFSQDANLGIFLGGDFLNANDSKTDWIYDRNLWIGIGINVNLSRVKTTEASKSSTEYTDKLKEKNKQAKAAKAAEAKPTTEPKITYRK